jgi:hypothetical protein
VRRRVACPALHQVKGVDAAAELLAHDQVCERLVLGGEGSVAVSRPGESHQVEGAVGSGRSPTHLRVGEGLACCDGGRPPGWVAVDVRSLNDHPPRHHIGRPAQRLLQEVTGLEHRVGDAQLGDLRALEHAVLVERVLEHDRQCRCHAHEVRQQVGASPAGHQAEEHLREREGRDT